jgi:3alpha(or 20beta)-hydroxysteroid dehydrogenase
MGRLDGKVAIVTGGGRGQGAEEARLFAAEGATVVATDVLTAEGEALAAAEAGVAFMRHDVTDEDRWEEIVAETVAAHGRVDVLVNNAGIFERKRMLEHTVDDFRRILDINVIGVFLGMKAVAPVMTAQGSGSIVNISSVAGILGSPGSIAYGASKFAVRGMTKSAAVELARHGVRVNSIHPGLIQTDMLDQVNEGDTTRAERMLSAVPMRRVAEPVEVARLALFLASDDSSYSTGSEFVVDGGVTAV